MSDTPRQPYSSAAALSELHVYNYLVERDQACGYSNPSEEDARDEWRESAADIVRGIPEVIEYCEEQAQARAERRAERLQADGIRMGYDAARREQAQERWHAHCLRQECDWAYGELELLQSAIRRVLQPALGVARPEPWIVGILSVAMAERPYPMAEIIRQSGESLVAQMFPDSPVPEGSSARDHLLDMTVSYPVQTETLRDEIGRLRMALMHHHDWHLAQVADEDGVGGAEAYAESELCERTVAALRRAET